MLDNVVYDFINYSASLLISPALQDVSNDIVSILVHRQICYDSHDLVCYRSYLLSWESFHYPLNYAASILISTKLSHLI